MVLYLRLCIDSERSKTITPFSFSNMRITVRAERPVMRATSAKEYTSLFSIWFVHSTCIRRTNVWSGPRQRLSWNASPFPSCPKGTLGSMNRISRGIASSYLRFCRGSITGNRSMLKQVEAVTESVQHTEEVYEFHTPYDPARSRTYYSRTYYKGD